MKRIRFFSNFCDSKLCKEKYERLLELSNNPEYGKEYLITNDDDYNFVVILNTAMPELKKIDKENVLGIACEPPEFLGLTNEFIIYAQKYIGRYLIGEKGKLPDPFIEHYGFMWHTPPPKIIPEKTKTMSIMISNKTHAPGHKYRHQLVKKILEEGLDIDIWGRGCEYYKNDKRIKGKFENIEPYSNYKFHIAIENFETNHYFSEKILDALYYKTTPIYLGCRNIDGYFPGKVLKLKNNIEEDIKFLKTILENPEKYYNPIEKEDIRQNTNLFDYICKPQITFSTCFYKLKSKFDVNIYEKWINNLISNTLKFNLVIYTNLESKYIIEKLVNGNKRIKLIIKEFEEFETYKYKDDFIENQKRNIYLPQIDWQLLMIWCEKISFVKQSIEEGYFKSKWHGWCDIGYFRCRDIDLKNDLIKKWPNEIKISQLKNDKIYYGNVNNNLEYMNNLFKLVITKQDLPSNQNSIAGGFFMITSSKINWWQKEFDNKLNYYLKQKKLVKDDQIILVDCIFNNLNNFIIEKENDRRFDNWFMFQRKLLIL